jgi:hypothetical protein
MNPKTKKYLLIGGAVVAVAAIWWFFGKKKTSASGTKKLQAPKGAIKKSVQKAAMARKGKPVETTGAPVDQQ